MSVASEETRALGAWSLDELLPSADEATVSGRMAEITAEVERLEAWRPVLTAETTGAELDRFLDGFESVHERMALLGGYASLRFAADTQSQPALTFRGRMQQALTGFENRLLFFSLWWKGLDDEAASRLLGEVVSADRRHFLADLRRLRPHTLPEASEQLINLKDADGIGAVLTAYSIVTNRLEFRFSDASGEPRTLTRDALMAHVHSTRPEEREAAYRELYRVFAPEETLLGQLYAHRVRDWHNEQVGLRGYASALAVRNVANDLPDEAVTTLLETARDNAPVFHRYFRWKAEALGSTLFARNEGELRQGRPGEKGGTSLEDEGELRQGRPGEKGGTSLRRYDLYAPVGGSSRTVEWADAVERVLDTFQAFHPRLGHEAARLFAADHVDSEPRKGKKGGAFCATILPRLVPWVLVNYNRRVRDVATLAHELGHAVHSLIASGHDLFTQHPSLPLAETASVFGEILVTQRLLAEERDAAARRDILVAALDDMYATVLRQAYFTLFEIEAHEAVLAGRSSDELSERYLELLREQFGGAVEVAEEFRHEWVTIPHLFHTPFYCYAYSFGQLLVLSLYRRYQDEGAGLVPGYLRMLEHGGSARPLAILAEAGVDPRQRSFWQGGFDVVRGFVDELEALPPA